MRWNRIALRLSYALLNGARTLRRNLPTNTLIIAALAAGIGLTTAMFSVLDGFLYRGLPVEDADRLVFLYRQPHRRDWVSPHDYEAYRSEQRAFTEIAAFRLTSVNLSDDATYPERYKGAYVSHEALALTGVQPAAGRFFNARDDVAGTAPVVVVSHRLWERRFLSEPNAVGRTIRVNGMPAELIGVLPPGFRFPVRQDVLLPLRLDTRGIERGEGARLNLFGRLRDGVGRRAAEAELNAVAQRLAAAHPQTSDGPGILVEPFTHVYLGPRFQRLFWTMQFGALLVLAVACTKAANLILLQAARQRRELGIRRAFGAGILDMVSRTLAESLLLATLGAAGGLAMATAFISAFSAQMAGKDLPFWVSFAVDGRAAMFTVAVALAVALAAGLYPAWRASRDFVNISAALHDGNSRATSRHVAHFQAGVVVVDVAMASLLLVLSLLFIRATQRLTDFDLGIEPRKVLTAGLSLPTADYPGPEQRLALAERLTATLAERPETDTAIAASNVPISGGRRLFFTIEGRDYADLNDHPEGLHNAVTPSFFETFNIPLLQGRLFSAQDRASTEPVAIVNRDFAGQVWPGRDPVGQRLRLGRNDPHEPWRTVVGVVPNAWMNLLGHDLQAGVYTPFAQTPQATFHVAVRMHDEPRDAAALREELHALDPGLPLFDVLTMDEWIEFERSDGLFFAGIYTLFGLVAVGLASVGLFAVVASSVSRRTREIGLRMALGSRRRAILRLILREGFAHFTVGLAVGLAAAAVVSEILAASLYDTPPHDPVAFLGTALPFAAIAVAACVVPAWRASRLEPAVALHAE